MGRPPRHTTDDLLDAAVRVFAVEGIRGVTMLAVARAAGAPSGSVYHRFPDRPSLLAALWLRTAGRFEDGYRDVLSERPTATSAVDVVGWTVQWCRENVEEAMVLQAGVRAFDPDAWNADARADLNKRDDARDGEVKAIVGALAEQLGKPADEVAFALLDVPLAVVRPHLLAGEPPPGKAVDLARRLTAQLLNCRS